MPKSDMAKAVSDATGRNVTDEAIFASVLNAAQQKGDLTELPEYQAGADFTPYGQSFQLKNIFGPCLRSCWVQ